MNKKEYLQLFNTLSEGDQKEKLKVIEKNQIKTYRKGTATYLEFDEFDNLKKGLIVSQSEFCREFLIGIACQVEMIIKRGNVKNVEEYIISYTDFYCDKLYKSMKEIEYGDYKHIIYNFGNYKLFFILHKKNKYYDYAGFGCEGE